MAGRVVKRAYKYRFYPTAVQAEQLARTFGCTRYVYNRALAERTRAWSQEQRRVTYADTSKMLTDWKRDTETAWLSEPSKGPLQESLRQLQGAFDRFWRKQTGYPQFKKEEGAVEGVGDLLLELLHLPRRADPVGQADRTAGCSVVEAAPGGGQCRRR